MQFSTVLLIMGLVIVFLLLFFLIGAEHTIPAFVRTDFDAICNRYFLQLQTNGGIPQQAKNLLVAELTAIGFTNIVITAPEAVAWGQEARLIVRANYMITTTRSNLTKESVALTATFDEKTIVMTLIR